MKYIVKVPPWNRADSGLFTFLNNYPRVKMCHHHRVSWKSFVNTHEVIVALNLFDYPIGFYNEVTEFDQYCQQNNIDTKLIIVSTIDHPVGYTFSKNIHWITIKSLYYIMSQGNEFIECDRKPIKKHFVSLSGRPMWYRHYLFYYLYKNNLLDKGHVSYLFDNFFKRDPRELFSNMHNWVGNEMSDGLDADQMYNMLPYKNFIEENKPKSPMELWTTVQDIYNESAISIETETYISPDLNNNAGFTEKALRPLAFGNPFLLIAPGGSLSTLRQIGFETYSNILDESYDTILDDEQRIKSVLAELNRISKLSIDELNSMTNSVADIIEHNQHHMLVTIKEQNKKDLINLEEYIKECL